MSSDDSGYVAPEQQARRRIDAITDNLPAPGVIAAEIVEDLQAALAEFVELAEALQGVGVGGADGDGGAGS